MIRLASKSDLSDIDRIYNQAVKDGFRTAHIQPMSTSERMEWFYNHPQHSYPVWVYEKNNKVVGWASFSPYRPGRAALNEVAEISFYIDFDFLGLGIGSQLMDFCLKQASALNKRILFAIIIEGNQGSIRLLEKFGFDKWGFLPEVFHFQNEKRGQIYMGKILDTVKFERKMDGRLI